MNTILLVPPLNSEVRDTTAPALHLTGDILAAPADINTGSVLEQLRRRRPLVRLELPGLAGCEDGDEAVPVLGLEVGRAIDDDELGWPGWFAACARANCACAGVGRVAVDAERALQFHEVGVCGAGESWVIWGYEDALFEEGFDV